MDAEQIASALRAEGVKVSVSNDMVMALFDVDGEAVPAFVFLPPAGVRDFMLFAPMGGSGPDIDELPAPKLRELIKAESDVELAKLYYDVLDDGPTFATTSYCSIEGYTGAKLRRRLEACAQLLRRVEAILG